MTVDDMNALAAADGGRCLSTRYRNYATMLEWECREGHRFRMRPHRVKTGSWCARCRGEASIVKTAIRRARKRGGALVSTRGVHVDALLTWCCVRGHRFKATPRAIARCGLCPKCRHMIGFDRRLTIEEMQEIARINGGRCISKTYANSVTKLHWQCAKGHRWWATPSSVKHADTWCQGCGIERQVQTWRANRKDRL